MKEKRTWWSQFNARRQGRSIARRWIAAASAAIGAISLAWSNLPAAGGGCPPECAVCPGEECPEPGGPEVPPGCTENSISAGITPIAFVDGMPVVIGGDDCVSPGQELFFLVTLETLKSGCDVCGGQLSMTFPNGAIPPVPPPGQLVQLAGFPGLCGVAQFSNGVGAFNVTTTFPYIVNADDAVGGLLIARVDYGSTAVRPEQTNGLFIDGADAPNQTASATVSIAIALCVEDCPPPAVTCSAVIVPGTPGDGHSDDDDDSSGDQSDDNDSDDGDASSGDNSDGDAHSDDGDASSDDHSDGDDASDDDDASSGDHSDDSNGSDDSDASSDDASDNDSDPCPGDDSSDDDSGSDDDDGDDTSGDSDDDDFTYVEEDDSGDGDDDSGAADDDSSSGDDDSSDDDENECGLIQIDFEIICPDDCDKCFGGAVIDIGCDLIPVEPGQLIDLKCDAGDNDDGSSDDDGSQDGSDDDGEGSDDDGGGDENSSDDDLAPLTGDDDGSSDDDDSSSGGGDDDSSGGHEPDCRFYYDGDVLVIRAPSAMLIVTASSAGGEAEPCIIDLCALLDDHDQDGDDGSSDDDDSSDDNGSEDDDDQDDTLRLFGPDHGYRPVDLRQVYHGILNNIVIRSIKQDEPVNQLHDGNTSVDATGIGSAAASVRAERVGGDDGRVYHLNFSARDASGAAIERTLVVHVPHGQTWQDLAVDDGALYDSTQVLMPADVNADHAIGIGDLLMLLAQWGRCGADQNLNWPDGDVNGDGCVTALDLLQMLEVWGMTY